MKLRLMVTALLVALTSSQLFASTQSHNLNFEQTQNNKLLHWTLAADSKQYKTQLEESQVQQGKYSASITFTGDKTGYEAWSYSIPSIYKGSKVTLKGYLKTENITKGRAGLMIHVGPPFKSSYMENIKVSGTNDWQAYEISVDSDLTKAKEIRVGAALIGNGKVWVDNLTVLIDGVPLSKAPKQEQLPAKLDDEFNNNSKIKIANLNEQSIADLAFLGKLWGFLKYHHPEIARGQFNWDFELFRLLPAYLAANSNTEKEVILTKWINKLGEVQNCVTCPVIDENARLKPSLAWLTESNFSDDFKALVKHIFVNRHQGDG